MKIATWNVERLRHKKQLDQIQGLCDGIHADILVLTETDKRLHPDYAFCCETTSLMGDKTIPYAVTENRVSLYTNYPVVRLHQTYDSRTALCAELKTEKGNLLVYGTIIGTLGNRHSSFMEQLHRQCDDIRRLSELGDGICVCGDFNCSFSDNYCFTQAARTRLNSDKVLFSFARGRERCDRNGHAVFLRPGVYFATTGSEITGISTSSTKLK